MGAKQWIAGILFGVIAGIALTACNQAKPNLIQASGTYGSCSITAPTEWIDMKGRLVDDALLEAGQAATEQYLFVLGEDREALNMTFEEYNEVVRDNSLLSLESSTLLRTAELTIAEKEACLFEISGTVNNDQDADNASTHRVRYWIYTINHDDAFFRIVSWTLDDKAEEYAAVMKSTALSLQITPNAE